ncbi:NUDIX domain-containing protein, partial [Escherichia coli]|nr:NUDIX domain-containing protein [Escherichia coli]
GKLKEKETPYECMVREVFEETGYQVQSAQYCGVIYFHYNHHEDEVIYVYQTNDYTGTLQECNEGTLAYIPKNEILQLELWEGDRIFLDKMFRNEIPFSISLYYDENEILVKTEVKEANTNE